VYVSMRTTVGYNRRIHRRTVLTIIAQMLSVEVEGEKQFMRIQT